jgi:Clostripain family
MNGTKEWTLMFYFASDNPLAPSIVSQLKALKNAGFHPEANVVARFDPHTVGTPLHTFDVNLVPKLEAHVRREALTNPEFAPEGELRQRLTVALANHEPPKTHQVGFPSNDPFIRNLVLDKLWGDSTVPNGDNGQEKQINDLIRDKLVNDTVSFLSYRLSPDGRAMTIGESVVETIKSAVESSGLIKYDPPDPDAFDLAAAKPNGAGPEKGSSGPGGNGKADATPGGAEPEKSLGALTIAEKARRRADKVAPKDALHRFLQFCAKNYPARHYMLFILGHGLIVGNDMFLLDEHADKPSLSLSDLGEVLRNFDVAINDKSLNQDIKEGDPKRELSLIGFHSCSMSSIEVAYELEGAARYMLASQGPEFVGSWPYTQILVRVFNDLVAGKKDIGETATKIFHYCFYNSYDFQLAGYSFDLSLCDLDGVSEKTVDTIGNLASELMAALGDEGGGGADEFIKGLILLAHWDAQSFWHDTYTDLCDFCLCLNKRCADALTDSAVTVSEETRDKLGRIQIACDGLTKKLVGDGGVILRSGFAGPSYQYSRGFSVFFPWSQPSNDDFWLTDYPTKYRFGQKTKWHDFLQRYFDNTMRATREETDQAQTESASEPMSESGESGDRLDVQLLDAITAHIFEGGEPGQLGKGGGSDAMGKGGGSDATGKGGGSDASGDDCDCQSIKNYPSVTRRRRRKVKSGDGEDQATYDTTYVSVR